MSLRPWIALCGGLVLAVAASAERPNVLLIVSDDQGWWDVGVNGNADIRTPALDRLAAEGVNLTRFYAEIAKRLRAEFEGWLKDVTQDLDFAPPPIEISAGAPIEIQASWARVNGTHTTWASPGGMQSAGPDPLGDPQSNSEINYTFAGYDWDTIDGWSKPGDSVSWRLDVADPGEYEVAVAYGCDPADAGGRLRISAGKERLEAVIEATPQHNVYAKRALGRLRLTKGPAELRAEVVSAPGRELMELNRIWLRRVGN